MRELTSKSVRSTKMRLQGKAAQPMVWRGHGDPAGDPDAPRASPWRRMDEQVVGAYERGSRPALDPAQALWCTHRLTYGVYGRPLWRPSQHLDPLTFRSSTVTRLGPIVAENLDPRHLRLYTE